MVITFGAQKFTVDKIQFSFSSWRQYLKQPLLHQRRKEITPFFTLGIFIPLSLIVSLSVHCELIPINDRTVHLYKGLVP